MRLRKWTSSLMRNSCRMMDGNFGQRQRTKVSALPRSNQAGGYISELGEVGPTDAFHLHQTRRAFGCVLFFNDRRPIASSKTKTEAKSEGDTTMQTAFS
jgi:hypothetical protein